MGSYLNPGSKGFQESLNSEIYVDKTGLIEKTNAVLDTRQKFLCVSRPRRFGKSMAADMLAAYYERGEDADLLFRSLKISKAESYRAHLKDYHGNLLLVGINYDKSTKKHECVIESLSLIHISEPTRRTFTVIPKFSEAEYVRGRKLGRPVKVSFLFLRKIR